MKKALKVFLLAAFLILFALPQIDASAATNKWQYTKGHWYYYNTNGTMQTGWANISNKWYYFEPSGAMKTGWLQSGGKWYYLNNSGAMQTGWAKVSNKWYYFEPSGVMKTGWLQSSSKLYYLNNSGAMQIGWAKVSNKWYYFETSGLMKTGWLKDGVNWYFLTASGSMATGWIQDGDTWYFLKNDGVWDPKAKMDDSNVMYYTVSGTASVKPGIYKAEPNGTSSAVLTDEVYRLIETSRPPIALTDVNYFTIQGGLATDFDRWGNVIKPIQSIQAVGADLYYTKFLFSGEYDGGGCGGGYADILELYKKDSSGNVTKLTNDKVSSASQQQFFISGSSLYYAKVEDQAFKNFTIIKMNLADQSKTILANGTDNFWVKGSTIYFVKNKQLYTMDLNGGNILAVANFNVELIGMNGCSEGNYTLTENGISGSYYDRETETRIYYFYDFTTKKLTPMPVEDILTTLNGFPWILDVDADSQIFAAYVNDYDSDKMTLGIYDFNGNLIKSLKVDKDYFSTNYEIISIDVKKRQFFYTEGSYLKLETF